MKSEKGKRRKKTRKIHVPIEMLDGTMQRGNSIEKTPQQDSQHKKALSRGKTKHLSTKKRE